MHTKFVPLLLVTSLASAAWNPLLPEDRGLVDPEFSYRCPLLAGGTRRISFDHKLFTSCHRPKDRTGDNDDDEGEWVWGELELGRCFANDDGIVRERYM